MRGWVVTTQLVDGTTASRTVTSDPTVADSDGDGLSDYQEANIRTDPRSKDTDDDQLNDYAEFNEIYSNALAQDSDGDTLDDFLEFAFFKTSPDPGRHRRRPVAGRLRDLRQPQPARVRPAPARDHGRAGQPPAQRPVHETNDQQQRDLETKSVTSTLTRSASQTFTRSDTVNVEAHVELGASWTWTTGVDRRDVYCAAVIGRLHLRADLGIGDVCRAGLSRVAEHRQGGDPRIHGRAHGPRRGDAGRHRPAKPQQRWPTG